MAVASGTAALAPQFDDPEQQRSAANLGIWIFLATEVLFFGVLFAAYAITRVRFPQAFAAASRLTNVELAGINTAVLLTSSLTMALAVHAAKQGARRALIGWLWLTVALGAAFLAIKAVEYRIDYLEQLVPSLAFAYAGPQADQVEVFFYLYFFITGVHALHVLIGIGCIAVIAVMASRGAFSPSYFTPVDVTGLYWHLVDIIWLFVFPMLYLVSRS
jgi:cytochrome c oxidase subunit 3